MNTDQSSPGKAAFICVKDTLDGAYPSLILGVNAARLGMETRIFFSFMGLNLLLRGKARKATFYPSGWMGAIPGMAALATRIMKKKIDRIQVPTIPELLEIAQLEGVTLVACKMTIDMMEVKTEQLLENVPVWTAEEFLKYARTCNVGLFT